MISVFHPSSLFCSSEEWRNPDFQDLFIEHLLEHVKQSREFNTKIAMSDDLSCYFWNNNPWNSSDNLSIKNMNLIYYKMQELFEMVNSPPDTICQIVPNIENRCSEKANLYWLILIHRLLHNEMKSLVIVGVNIEIESDSLDVFCNCHSEEIHDKYSIIKKPLDWYVKIDYMEKCPDKLDVFDENFKLTLKMCREQEFGLGQFKTKLDDIVFNEVFKNDFLGLRELNKKNRIIKSITKLLTLDHHEAGFDAGLREEIINGEFRIRISRGERIHYIEENGVKVFLKYYSSSEHDVGI